MPPSLRLRLKQYYENNCKDMLTAQKRSSPDESPISSKRQPFKSIYGNNPITAPQPSVALEQQTNLIDLNYDCLEHIFNGFCLTDLIAVGGTCTYLQSVACRYFQSKFRKFYMFIDCDQYPCYSISKPPTFHSIDIGTDIEAFLFVFGGVLSKLTIRNMCPIRNVDPERLEHDAKIQQLIDTYCRKSLHEIKFQHCGKLTMHHAQPFEEVTKISFDRCILGDKVANFQYLFPRMRKLDLIDCDVRSVRQSIEKEFPQLEYFNLSVPFGVNSWSESSFTVANVKTAIERNPNLKSLNLCYWNLSAYDAKLLKYAAANLHQLKSLQLWHLRYTDFYSDGDIHFPTVQKLTLANHLHQFGTLDRNLAALSFESLRKFAIVGQYDSECTNFIARHKTIKELSIVPNGNHEFYPSDQDIARIFSILPNLEKFLVNGSYLTPKGLIRLVSKRSNLLLIKVHQYTFSAVIRILFRWKCIQLGWNVVFCAGSESDMIIKRF